MALYNLTGMFVGNETGLLTLIQGVNTELMNGLLGTMFLIGVSIVLLIAFIMTTNDVGKSVSATGFIAMSLAFSLVALDLLPPLGMFITLIVAGISIATTWKRS